VNNFFRGFVHANLLDVQNEKSFAIFARCGAAGRFGIMADTTATGFLPSCLTNCKAKGSINGEKPAQMPPDKKPVTAWTDGKNLMEKVF
jgi:hypothetical protein